MAQIARGTKKTCAVTHSITSNNNSEMFTMKTWFLMALAVLGGALALSSDPVLAAPPPEEIRIWPGVAPGSEGWTQKESKITVGTHTIYRNVVTPTLTVYAPEPGTGNGTGFIICPGGGFVSLAWDKGAELAAWLAARGVTAFVLKYRLQATSDDPAIRNAQVAAVFDPRLGFEASAKKMDAPRAFAVADGRQAVKYVREHAGQWHLAADRIGLMGFSAGGWLTMGVIMDHDPISRPDFAASFYGINLDDRPPPADAPPLFIAAGQADELVPVEQSVRIFQKWNAVKLPAELHVFARASHGFGMEKRGSSTDHWPDLLESWLNSLGLLSGARRG